MDRDFDGRLSFEEFMGEWKQREYEGMKVFKIRRGDHAGETLQKHGQKQRWGCFEAGSIFSDLPPNQSSLAELLGF